MAASRTQTLGKLLLAITLMIFACLFIRNAVEAVEASRWVGLDIGLQCWALGLAFMVAIKSRVDLSDWGWAGIIGIALSVGDPLANHVHGFMMDHRLYPSFFGRGNDAQQSPQYARLLLWSIVTVVAWFCVLKRGFARHAMSAIALLGATSVLATSLIFHVVVVYVAKADMERLASQAKFMLIESSSNGFDDFCASSHALCARGEEAKSELLNSLPSNATEQFEKSWAMTGRSGAGSVAAWRQPTLKNTFNRLPAMMAMVGVAKSGEQRAWVDMDQLPAILKVQEAVFAWLGLWAHGTWIFGSLGLGWWHDKRIKTRHLKQIASNESPCQLSMASKIQE